MEGGRLDIRGSASLMGYLMKRVTLRLKSLTKYQRREQGVQNIIPYCMSYCRNRKRHSLIIWALSAANNKLKLWRALYLKQYVAVEAYQTRFFNDLLVMSKMKTPDNPYPECRLHISAIWVFHDCNTSLKKTFNLTLQTTIFETVFSILLSSLHYIYLL